VVELIPGIPLISPALSEDFVESFDVRTVWPDFLTVRVEITRTTTTAVTVQSVTL
jgi:hypothetical protein